MSGHRSKPNKTFVVLQGMTVLKELYSNDRKPPFPLLKNTNAATKRKYSSTHLSEIASPIVSPTPATRTRGLTPQAILRKNIRARVHLPYIPSHAEQE